MPTLLLFTGVIVDRIYCNTTTNHLDTCQLSLPLTPFLWANFSSSCSDFKAASPRKNRSKFKTIFFSSSTLGHFLWNWKWNDVIREFCPLLYFVKCIFNRFGNLYGINPTDLSVGRWRRKNVKAISFWSTTTPGRPRAPFVADDHIASFLLSTTSTEHSSDLLKLVKSVRFSSSWKCDARDGTLLFPSSLEDVIIQLKFYEQNVLKCSARLRHRNKDLEST